MSTPTQVAARRQLNSLVTPLFCSLTLLVVLILLNSISLPAANDVEIYYNYTRRSLNGELPYRDFLIEYPPLSLLFFLPPALVAYPFGLSLSTYTWLLHGELFLLNVASLWLIYDLLQRRGLAWWERNRRLWLFTWGSALIALYLLQRFDIGIAFLTLLAVWCYQRERPAWVGVWLAVGTLAKLYPALLLPLFLLVYWYGARDRRAAWRCVIGFGVAGVGLVLPFVVTGLDGLRGFVAFQGERGVELESLFAGLIVLGSYLNLTHALSMVEHGGLGLASNWVKPLATLSTALTLLGLLVLLAFLWRSARRQPPADAFEWLLNASSLLILWFVLANKVISPQYLIWLLVFAPFWRGRAKTRLLLACLPLSFLPFPFLVDDLILLNPLPFVILAVRNGLLVIIFSLLLRDVFSKPKPPVIEAKAKF